MIKLYALVAAAVAVFATRLEKRREDGLGTLELVVLGLGLLLFATAAVAVFKAAIDSRTAQIN